MAPAATRTRFCLWEKNYGPAPPSLDCGAKCWRVACLHPFGGSQRLASEMSSPGRRSWHNLSLLHPSDTSSARRRLVVVGYSNGATLAASLILSHPHYLAAAVLFRAMVPLVPDLIRNFSHLS